MRAKQNRAYPPAQVHNLREIYENMTILLGVISSQGTSIKAIQEDISGIKDRLDRLETHSNEHTRLLTQHTAFLTQILARLPEKPQ